MQSRWNTCLLIALVASLFHACKKEDSPPRFSATLNGQNWQPDASNIQVGFRNGQIRFTHHFSPFSCDLTFVVDGQSVGQYVTGRDQFSYVRGKNQDCIDTYYTDLEDLNTGSIEITAIDHQKKTVSGKFSFTAKSTTATSLKAENGVFENVAYFEEAGNSANKANRSWVEEEGTTYALNDYVAFQSNVFYAATSSRHKTVTLYFPGTLLTTGDYDLTPLDVADGNIHLVYNLIRGLTANAEYEPGLGSKMHLTVLPGSGDFLATFDLNLVKNYGDGPETLHLKSSLEAYE